MATAEDLLRRAFQRSVANQNPDLASEPELLAHLDSLYQRFYALAAMQRPNLFTTRTSLTLMGNPATAVMSPVPIELRFIFNEDEEQVNEIDNTDRARVYHLAPCIYREGARLTSRAHGGDPVACDILELTVIDTPVALDTLAALVDPRFVRHHQLLVDGVALYLDAKDDQRDQGVSAKLVREYGQGLAAFAAEYELAPEALQWAHAPAKRKPAAGGAAAA